MISDILHDAVVEMDKYLNSLEWQDTYTGQTRKELEALRNMMDVARKRLDTPDQPTKKHLDQLEVNDSGRLQFLPSCYGEFDSHGCDQCSFWESCKAATRVIWNDLKK